VETPRYAILFRIDLIVAKIFVVFYLPEKPSAQVVFARMAQPCQPPNEPSELACRAAKISWFLTHNDLFQEIDNNHPEADVRQRFLRARAIRAKDLEWKVEQCVHDYDKFGSTSQDVMSPSTQAEFDQILARMNRCLEDYSTRKH
jgi:hypothetical protein